jgi:predicted RNA-binding Zn ribbon-like protein
MTAQRRIFPAIVVSGFREDLCLAYANTLSWRGSAAPVEQLGDLDGLFAWLAGPGGLGGAAVEPLAARARRRPAEAAALFGEAIALREAIYRIFGALARGTVARAADLALLNRVLADAPARRRLVRSGDGYGWRIDRPTVSAPSLLASVLWSAGDLLARGEGAPIRQCANEKCLWLFVDASKGATRRWCDMASCGNRAKARRHYLRSKQA